MAEKQTDRAVAGVNSSHINVGQERKRLHPLDAGQPMEDDEVDDLIPPVKRSPRAEESGDSDIDSISSGPGEYPLERPGGSMEEDEDEGKEEERMEKEERNESDALADLPSEALMASSLPQFSMHMKPYLWMQYPSATAGEISSLVHSRWKALKSARREQAGEIGAVERRKRSEMESLGASGEVEEDESSGRRTSRRRAAKNLAKNAYIFDQEDVEFAYSPASSTKGESGGGKKEKEKEKEKKGRGGGRRGGRRRRRGGAKVGEKGEPKVPPMKIKLIGRSGETDSPIFFAESLGEYEEGSGSERGGLRLPRSRYKALLPTGGDSETSSLLLGERDEETSGYEESSKPPSEGEEDVDVEGMDSEGEHADFCYICKDGGELLCCDICPLAYHLGCLIPPMDTIPDGEWSCPRCEAEKLPGRVERIVTWRWTDVPIKRVEEKEESEGEDEVMQEETESGKNKPPEKHQKAVQTYRIREFLVKWVGKSNWKNSWVCEIRLDVHQQITLRAYMRKRNMDIAPLMELPPHVERRHKRRSTASHYDVKMEEKELMLLKAGIKPLWLQIHRVINKRTNRKGTQYLVKWRELPYDQATWEYLGEDCGLRGAAAAVEHYEQLRRQMDPRKKDKKSEKRGRGKHRKAKVDPKEKYEEQPEYITSTGGTLHSYQLEGLNWLRFSWAQHTNTILADEMGLGKTIQTIAFLRSLVKEGHCNGPFLITAPLSTIVNWEREFEFWAPDLYVVTYNGYKENRAAIRENEFSFVEGAIKGGTNKLYKMKKDAPVKFHVLLTSYEFVSVDVTVLQSIDWEVLVVDEAHRLKNNQSKFFRVLSSYNLKYKLLLTGTPLQNNLEELFHLLNFLNPDSFNSLEQFQEEFEDISKEEQIQKLHELLAPHLLRRLKADVLKNIPSKRELIVRVELSPMQKKFYRWILTRNFEKLNQRGTQPVSLLNVMMDLKKCCNHPYLFPTASQEAPLTMTGYYEGTSLIQACGKFIVLEKMLKKLKENGHRVLIFSQMTRMLDILEDFLEHLGFQYERIDGSVTGVERQQSIDRFNAPNAPQFVFLLSTRAGGLGINLATADTVIIYDSDWNPHNDIQAFSRAHRIGQDKRVMIYRFVTRGSVEERITEVAKRKMMLTHLVVRPGMGSSSAPSLTKRELDGILRFGTEELFKEESGEQTSIHYDDKAIEALLDRSQEGEEEGEAVEGDEHENLLANEYLSSFKVASYVMKEKDQEVETEILKEESDQPDPDFWEKLLRHHYEQQRELEAAKLGKGKRVRKQVNYLDASIGYDKERDSDQSSYQQSDEEQSEEDSDGDVEFSEVYGGKKRVRQVAGARTAKMGASQLPPLLAKVNDVIQVYGFNPRQRKAFLNSVMRYGMPSPNAFHTNWRPKELRNVPENTFNAYVNMFMRHLCEPDTPTSTTYSDGVPKESASRQNILTRIGIMRLVRNKVEQYSEINGTYSIPSDAPPPQPSSVIQEPTTAQPSTVKKEEPERTQTSQAEGSDRDGGEKVNVTKIASEQIIVREENVAMEMKESAKADASRTGSPTQTVEKEKEEEKTKTGSVLMSAESTSKVNIADGDKNGKKEEEEEESVGTTKEEKGGQGEEGMEVETSATAGGGDSMETEAGTTVTSKSQDSQEEDDKKKAKESVIKQAPPPNPPATADKSQQRFMFNIADGGFTELHSLWAEEKTRGMNPAVWGRHHDYWLLKGIVTHGYCRWSEICSDLRFSLLNKPFSPDEFVSVSDSKSRFLLKRFKLLEQALAVEEQLHRASNANLIQDPNHSVMQLHSRFTDLDCLADGHHYLVKECTDGDRKSILFLRKALAKMEDLLMEMKADVTRLPNELAKIPSVSHQLKMDEISTLSKLASKGTIATSHTHSVITQAPSVVTMATSGSSSAASGADKQKATSKPATGAGKSESIVVQKEQKAQYGVAYAATGGTIVQAPVQLATGSGLAVPGGDGVVVYTMASNTGGTQYATIQQQSGSAQTSTSNSSQTQTTYAIGVPTYVDGNMYLQGQTVQLVPVSGVSASNQQVVYWPVQQGGQTAVSQATAVAAVPQLAMVQGSSPAVLQPVQYVLDSKTSTDPSTVSKASIITID